jgi:hypothetical protein
MSKHTEPKADCTTKKAEVIAMIKGAKGTTKVGGSPVSEKMNPKRRYVHLVEGRVNEIGTR